MCLDRLLTAYKVFPLLSIFSVCKFETFYGMLYTCIRGLLENLKCGCVYTQVSEMAVSELPGNPNAVWTVRRHVEGICLICSLRGKHLLRMYCLKMHVVYTIEAFFNQP